jgi:hypothetical protein
MIGYESFLPGNQRAFEERLCVIILALCFVKIGQIENIEISVIGSYYDFR